jgi:hypothetical protein
MRLFGAFVCAFVAAAALIGCQSEQASGLDEGIIVPPTRAEAQKKQQPERILPDYEDEETKEGPLDFLAFWKGDDEGETEPPRVTEGEILGNLSPEMTSRKYTPGEVDRHISKTFDRDGQGAWDDILYHLMLDKPSRLSMVPTP